MLIEKYKGIDIKHDAAKDEFFTNIIIRKGGNGKKDEYISAPRLQRLRDELDKFLNTAAKKPVLKKVWAKGKYDSDQYKLAQVILFNSITGQVIIKYDDGNTKPVYLTGNSYSRDEKLFLSCKENDSILKLINQKLAAIKAIEKELSCTRGKLIPLELEHFKK